MYKYNTRLNLYDNHEATPPSNRTTMASLRDAFLLGGATLMLACITFWALNNPASEAFFSTLLYLCLFQKAYLASARCLREEAPPAPPSSASPALLPLSPSSPSRSTAVLCLTNIPVDILLSCLRYLDGPSLLRFEMAARLTPDTARAAAIEAAWSHLDSMTDPNERVNRATPRDRVIGSCPQYRHCMLAEYAAKVASMEPSGTETVHALLDGASWNNFDVYLLLQGCKGETRSRTFLAGGIVKPGDLNGRMLHVPSSTDACFELNENILPLLSNTLVNDNSDIDGRDRALPKEAEDILGDVVVTLVSMHKKDLNLAVLFACDNISDGKRFYAYPCVTPSGPILEARTDFSCCPFRPCSNLRSMSMTVSAWDSGREITGDTGRLIAFYYQGNQWGLQVFNSNEENAHRCNCCMHQLYRRCKWFCVFFVAAKALGTFLSLAADVCLLFICVKVRVFERDDEDDDDELDDLAVVDMNDEGGDELI